MHSSNHVLLPALSARQAATNTFRSAPSFLVGLLIAVSLGTNGAAQVATETPPTVASEPIQIKIADASKFVDTLVETELQVQSAKLMDDRKICFLNSAKDHRETSNFSIVIKTGEVLEAFAASGITDPAEHFLNKTIRVVGKVQLHRERPQLMVTQVDQIVIVDQKPQALGSPSDEAVPAE